MPGTTRYSATFDRTYEEEDRVDPSPPTTTRRSRSQSWQAPSGLDGRPYTPFGGRPPTQRSSSTDSGPKGSEQIPTRTARTAVKAHNNPFQFVKVGTCPLYKHAEEQLKKVKEVKKPDVLKEEEEEWQSNLDSWKSRRRKMSEDVFRRQEEIKQLELEEQIAQVSQKKTKTFSEMVESRATRGRALSLCLISSPLEFQNWEYENKTHKNGSCSYTDESGENSTVNSEDEGVSVRGRLGKASQSENDINHRTNGDAHIEQNGSKLNIQNGDYNKLSDNVQMKPKENSYIDSGLESISSSHRAGDTPDSGSDFSQDSNSSIDCDSPRTGVNVLEEFSSKSSQMSQGREITVKLNLEEKGRDFGFTFLGGKDEGQVLIASVLEGSKAESSGIHLGDRIITIDGTDVNSKKHIEIAAVLQKGREKGQISLLLWRHSKSVESTNGFNTDEKHIKPSKPESQNAKSYEKSIESENEMYVDDFEELRRQTELLTLSKKPEITCTGSQEQTNGNKSPTSNKDALPLKISSENSAAPKLKENISNGAVAEPNKNELKTNSEINSDNQKKNVVKVKKVRRKGVYALNVDPNQIPQEGISVNSLFPLSPVTELPSPADETKTMASTLSSNNTIVTSNSQNDISNKEKPRESEVKLSTPIVKENNKTDATTPKTVSPKAAVRPVELKISEKVGNKIPEKTDNKTPEKTENKTPEMAVNKTESSTIPSSPTIVKNKEKNILSECTQAENSKPPTAPKKMKVKVKKGTASENASATSPSVKEPSSCIPFIDAPAKTVTKEKTPIESKSTPQIADKQVKITNGIENSVTSQTRENGAISSGTTSITPSTEATSAKNKMPTTGNTESNVNGNQSPKICAKIEAADLSSSLTNNKSKITTITSEDDKPKPVAQKKVKAKPKSVTEQIPSDLPQVVKEKSTTSISNTSDPSTKNTVTEFQPKKEQKPTPLTQDKQEKIMTKNKTIVSSLTKEYDALSARTTTAIPDIKTTGMRDKICNTSTSSDKNKNLSLKDDAKSELVSSSSSSLSSSPVTDAKPPKTPQSEKSKTLFLQKKESTKLKENTTEQIPPDSLQVTKDTLISSVSNTSDLSTKTTVKESLPKKEQKPSPLIQDKQAKVATKNETTASPITRESGVPSVGITTVIPDAKPTSTKEKILDMSASTDKTRNPSLKIDAKNESVNSSSTSSVINAKPPKTPQGEKSKPVFPQKKENAKLKGNTTEQIPVDSLQVTKDAPISSLSNTSDSSTKSTVKESLPKKEQKPIPLAQDKQVKLATKNETTASPLARENGVASAGITTVIPDMKPTSTKDKIPNTSATDKTRNLSLKIDVKNELVNSTSASPVANTKSPKTPQGEKSKPVFSQKKENTKLKVNSTSSKHGCDLM